MALCIAPYRTASAADNPLIGSWAVSDTGWGGCAEQKVFSRDHQHQVWKGIPQDAPAVYSVQGDTVYVQAHQGRGGTEAFIIVGPNEIKDTIGYRACHWTRQ